MPHCRVKSKYSSIHPNQSHTENWVQNGDSVFWKLDFRNPGKYRVEIQYGCPALETGSKLLFHSNTDSFGFIIDKAYESKVLRNRDYVERNESVERTWTWMPIGKVFLKAGPECLVIKLQQKKKQHRRNDKGHTAHQTRSLKNETFREQNGKQNDYRLLLFMCI